MFPLEYATWIDLLLDNYVLSVLISIVFILITFVISKVHVNPNISLKSYTVSSGSASVIEEKPMDESMSTASSLTMSPALRAEKVIEANMTEEQRLLEQQVRQKQLAQIYELMQKQSDKFGNISLDEVEEQMKLYQ